MTDQEERAKLYEQAQVIMHDQAPFFLIAHSVVYLPMRKNVIGYKMSPFGRQQFETSTCSSARRHSGTGRVFPRGSGGAAPPMHSHVPLPAPPRGLIMPTFIGVTLLSFMLIHLVPGDPIEVRVRRTRHRAGAAGDAAPRIRPRPAAVAAVPALRSAVAHGDLGSRWSRIVGHGPSSRRCSRRPSSCRCAPSCSRSHRPAARHDRGGAPRLDVRLRADGLVRHRRLHADLLVGADDDPGLLRRPGLDAGVGPHLRRVLRRAMERLPARSIAWFSDDPRRVRLGALALDTADDRAGHRCRSPPSPA